MSSTNRQNSLLVAEDWKKIYQTFREADFQSYDFETIRKSMIDYLRLYYPEDFNDFIESSEYIALIDLLAFLGQSLAFRTDLNARENFMDTAERRDSILKLARLVSYSPKRCTAATGLLKINSISTTENLSDSNGVNLANLVVSWNDATNDNWLEQFTLILNATLLNSQVIGKSGNSQVINGVRTDEYTINTTAQTLSAYPFVTSVNGQSMAFEVVSATSINQPYIYEVDPKPTSRFNILYRADSQGNGSNNTGFFVYFKQGTLQSIDFALSESVPNRVLNVGFNNINNTDVWLYGLNSSNVEDTSWKAVPAVAGVNVIYNKSTERNLYQVNTRTGDQIDLVFGDGSFSNIPQGNYRIYFRTSNGLTYKITPDEIQSATIPINYVSRAGKTETLTVYANLNYSVTNANANETIEDIRQKAPQQYYTQNRMITGEDYNIVPYTSFSNIVKVKAVNRTSSGVSRYLDINDSSGKYSSTNIFAQDGILYTEDGSQTVNFSFVTTANVQQEVEDQLTIILNSRELLHFYYDVDNFPRVKMNDPAITSITDPLTWTADKAQWNLSSVNNSGCTGYFWNLNPNVQLLQLSYVSSTDTKYINTGAVIRFKASEIDDENICFNSQNQIVNRAPKYDGDKRYIFASVLQIIGDGTNGGTGNFYNGQGPVTLSQVVPGNSTLAIPAGAWVDEIIPVFKNSLPQAVLNDITTRILNYSNFSLRYNSTTQLWEILTDAQTNTDETVPFDSTSSTGWLIRFEYNPNIGYSIRYRGLDYVFESVLETRFYFDENVRVYDSKTGTTLKDTINILKINPALDSIQGLGLGIDYPWYIYKNIVDVDGYENQSKVLVTFTDSNADGIPDNPDIFTSVVAPASADPYKYVFFKIEPTYDSFITYTPVASSLVVLDKFTEDPLFVDVTPYPEGQLFFIQGPAPVPSMYILTSGVLVVTTEYTFATGREKLYFQYRHNSPGYRRIDPSPDNIIDLYLLTNTYATDYQNWIRDTTGTLNEPLAPSSEQLKLEYGTLENSKAISDSIIFNSARFKPLFGAKSDPLLQATFKVVKNTSVNISDNDIKSNVINAINTFFTIDNWDFGETFYFSELSAYLHSVLSPNVSSIIIVPLEPTSMFGSLYQINAEANEIVTSSATVDNVELISAITASQINANMAGVNTNMTMVGSS